MKKLLVLLLIGCAFFAFTSCKKKCDCKSKEDGTSWTVNLKDNDLGTTYKNCKKLSDAYKLATDGDVTCK